MIPHEPERFASPHAFLENLLIKPHGDLTDLQKRLRQHGAELVKPIGSCGAHLVGVPAAKAEGLAIELLNARLVDYAQPDVLSYFAAIPNDTLWVGGLENFNYAFDYQKGGSINVAVLDSGCTQVTDFGALVLSGWNVLNSTNSVTDSGNHGTACCSVIAADTNNGATGGGVGGMGWGIQVVPIKVTSSGSILDSNSTAGITWVVANAPNAKLISMSYAGPSVSTTALSDEITAAWNAGFICVASAGNTGTSVAQYPAANANCVAAAGRIGYDGLPDSSFGSWTDTAGHYGIGVAENFRCYLADGTNTSFGGTSCSSPVLCAALALLWSNKTSLTNQQLLDLVMANADPMTGTTFGSPPHPGKCLNLYRAMDALRSDVRRGSAIAFGGF